MACMHSPCGHADTLLLHNCRHTENTHTHTHTNTHTHTHTETQPHFTALWHKMGFLCLSRGGPMVTEGHIKKWGLYNRWCQIGCQLQHKWPSITSAPHVKRPLYRRLDFRQHRKSLLPPAHSTALQGGLHTAACIHAYIRKADKHMTFTHTAVNIHTFTEAEKHLEAAIHTHLHCNPHTTPPSETTSQTRPWASSMLSHTTTRYIFWGFLLVCSSSLYCSHPQQQQQHCQWSSF